MTVNPISPASLLDHSLTPEETRAEMEIFALLREKQVQLARGSAIVALIEAAILPPVGKVPPTPSPPAPGINEVA